jgi:hypothetical protein
MNAGDQAVERKDAEGGLREYAAAFSPWIPTGASSHPGFLRRGCKKVIDRILKAQGGR